MKTFPLPLMVLVWFGLPMISCAAETRWDALTHDKAQLSKPRPASSTSSELSEVFADDFKSLTKSNAWIRIPFSLQNKFKSSFLADGNDFLSFVSDPAPEETTDAFRISSYSISAEQDWEIHATLFLVGPEWFSGTRLNDKLGISVGVVNESNPFEGADIGFRYRFTNSASDNISRQIYTNLDNQGDRKQELIPAGLYSLDDIFLTVWMRYIHDKKTLELGVFRDSEELMIAEYDLCKEWNLCESGNFLLGFRGYTSRVDSPQYSVGIDRFRLLTSSLVTEGQEMVMEQKPSITINTEPGKSYRIQYSENLENWEPWGDWIEGTGESLHRIVEGGNLKFYRLWIE